MARAALRVVVEADGLEREHAEHRPAGGSEAPRVGEAAHELGLEEGRLLVDELLEHLAGAQLWFESFQNWRSEFLSTFAVVVLGIYLRQRGSPGPKPVVAAPHGSTGH